MGWGEEAKGAEKCEFETAQRNEFLQRQSERWKRPAADSNW